MIHKKYHLNQKRSHVTVHWMPTAIGLTPLTELTDLHQNREQGKEIAWYHSSGFERLVSHGSGYLLGERGGNKSQIPVAQLL